MDPLSLCYQHPKKPSVLRERLLRWVVQKHSGVGRSRDTEDHATQDTLGHYGMPGMPGSMLGTPRRWLTG